MTKRVGGNLTIKRARDIASKTTQAYYVSTCIPCGGSIFSDHKYSWQGCDGLTHDDCDNPK